MMTVQEDSRALIIRPGVERITRGPVADDLRDVVHTAVADGWVALALDFEGVEYADRAVIRLLLTELKYLLRNDGLMSFFNCGPALSEFFRETVIDELVELRATKEEALGLFANRPARRREPVRMGQFVMRARWWGFQHHILPDPRRPGDRRGASDRRRFADRRRARNGQAAPAAGASAEPQPQPASPRDSELRPTEQGASAGP